MQTILTQMLSRYDANNIEEKKNAIKEVVQEIALCGLARAGFFKQAAFYGGTALRIFYGLDRFSEDLDFSLITSNLDFELSPYFSGLKKELASVGLNFQIEEKLKSNDSYIRSAFLKGNTKEHIISIYDEQNNYINPNEVIKIKFEIDVNPPKFATFENKYRLLPSPYEVKLYDKSSLFAGKVHAVICRSWKNRIKGRDLYDYVFYLSNQIKINLPHLRARLEDSDVLKEESLFTMDILKQMLIDRFDIIDFDAAKNDVIQFTKDPSKLDLWSKDFFVKITENFLE
ncbi:MAG: nucleotidyl transferase AbiEii/AbiGii toxin family protein [Alphaproteobacteria bacterium]|nr:nucleotidyl transferase AbiEii/AbiGii toxin family protein [Alphaproteobacteria bacterium]